MHHDTGCTFNRNPKKLAECVKSINIGCNDLNIPSVGIKEATKVRVTKNKTAGGTFYHFGRNHKQLSGIKRGGASQEFRKPDTRVSERRVAAATWQQPPCTTKSKVLHAGS